MLPRMAPADVQANWTGNTGAVLLGQSVNFVRLVESLSIHHTGRSLHGRRILDFGCGYGRLMRLLAYHTDPEQIVGVDAWEQSLELARHDGVLGTLVKSDDVPADLPVSEVDIAFAFSV